MGQVLFLNYHSLDIGKRAAPYHVDPVYSVKRAHFAAQLRLISELKVPVLSLLCSSAFTLPSPSPIR